MDFNHANTRRFNLAIAQLTHEDLRVVQFTHHEYLSQLYKLDLQFISENHFLTTEQLLKHSARLSISGENDIQYINGIILSAECQEIGRRFARYAITIVPRIWLLNYRKSCRIFQHLSVPQIVNTVLKEAGLTESEQYQWSTDRSYPEREYCVQYNETQWAFISRLLSEEGIHFHFQHDKHKHLMVFGDSKTALNPIGTDPLVPYRSRSGLVEQQEHVNSFGFSHQVISNSSSFRDYNFKTPKRSLSVISQATTQKALENYNYPGLYAKQSEGQFYADLQQQRHQVQEKTGHGISNVQRLRAGYLFTLQEHHFKNHNIEQLVTSVIHHGEQLQSLDEDTPATLDNSQYYNEFYTIPADIPFRPHNKHQKPLIHGQQYAFVTGPEGEEIYLNKYGQVKVQFLWDRQGQQDEKTTCWIRVNNEIAGKQWGHIMPPRIGQLVLVEFEQGNPDRPLVSGRLYHGDALPPYTLPQHKTRSTTKSHSTPNGKGYNEIRFEDKKSQEQIYFHAQKDQDIRCKHDKRETIGKTRSLIVENNQYEHTKHDQHQKIEQNLQQQVGTQLSEQVGQTKHIKVGQKHLQSAGHEIHIKSTNTILEAGTEITFKASGGFIKIDPSGVTINGITVNLNGGGSASSAASAAPQSPTAAVEADKNKPGQSFKPVEPEQAYKLSEYDFSSIKNLNNKRTYQSSNIAVSSNEPYEIVIATNRETIDEYLSRTYPQPDKVKETFILLNQHLTNNQILPLQVLILPQQNLLACPQIPGEIIQYIKKVEKTLLTLDGSTAHELAYNHFDLLYTVDQSAQTASAATGLFSAGAGNINKTINHVLKNIESAYIRHINNPEKFPKNKFYQYRQQQLKTLKSPLARLLMKQMKYNMDTNILRQLGLKEGQKKLARSIKSSNGLPKYTENLERVARQARQIKALGYLSIALDAVHSGNEIYKACTTGREKECTKSKYIEGGRLTGGIVGGAMGGYTANYLLCNLAFGLESAGTSLLWCGLIIGGTGAYLGGQYGGSSGQDVGTIIYRFVEDD